jgi:hypothetical protein
VNGGGVQNGTPVTGTVSTGAVGPPVWYSTGAGNYPLSYSTNAINWTVQNFAGCTNLGGYFQSCAYNGTVAVGAYYNGNISYSSNFTNWTVTAVSNTTIGVVAMRYPVYGNGVFVFGGNNTGTTNVIYSTNGSNWTAVTPKPFSYGLGIARFNPYLNIFMFSVSNTGNTLMYSSNAITWTGFGNLSGVNDIAFSTTSDMIVLAVNFTLYYCTNNIGLTLTPCPSPPSGFNGGNSRISGLNFLNGLFLAGGNKDTVNNTYNIAYSSNGINWTGTLLTTASYAQTGIYNFGYTSNAGGIYHAVGDGGNCVMYSTNALNWSTCYANTPSTTFSGQACFVIPTNLPPPPPMWLSSSGLSGKSLAYSTNAVNWTAFAAGGGIDAQGGMDTLQYNGSIWVGKTGNGTLQYCSNSNGTNWTFATTGSTSTFNGTNTPTWLAYGKGCWVCGGASGNGNTLAYSANGVTWTGLGKLVPFNANSNSVIFNAYLGVFMTTGNGGANTYGYSSNGIHWTGFSTAGVLKIVASSTTNMIVASINNTLSYTTGGLGSAFTTCPSLPTGFSNNSITGLGFANNLFFAGCQNGFTYTLAYSANGINWTGVVLSTLTNNLAYTYAFNYSPLGKVYNAAGQGGNCMLYSTDAINWTTIILVGNCFNATAYFVVSNS